MSTVLRWVGRFGSAIGVARGRVAAAVALGTALGALVMFPALSRDRTTGSTGSTSGPMASAAARRRVITDVVAVSCLTPNGDVSAKDNTLFESATGALSDGLGSFLYVGVTNQSLRRRALIAFDLTGLGIPPGADIVSATLRLHRSIPPPNVPAPDSIAVYRVLEDWGQGTSDSDGIAGGGGGAPSTPGDATWIHTFYNTSFWSNPGGDFAPAESANISVGTVADFYNSTGTGLGVDVQAWLADPASNHGWLLKDQEVSSRTGVRFDSCQGPEATRPTLSVTYVVSVVTGACCSTSGCQVLAPTDCSESGGAYQGDGTVCGPDTCPRPATGACCVPDATAACSVLTSADCTQNGRTYQGDNTSCGPETCPVVLAPFVDPLPIPPTAQPVSGQPGMEATYAIAMRQFGTKFHRDLPATTVWGYGDASSAGGSVPGPTIEARRDQTVTVDWINDLRDDSGQLRKDHYLSVDQCLHGGNGPEPRTVVHLHGAHVRPDSDGYPEFTFLPGGDALYHYPNHQNATTLWYHDHALGITRLNVYMGLAGFYLIRDSIEQRLGLPAGQFEIPLMIMDRSFRPDGSLVYPQTWQEHFFGDTIVVNGKVWPYLDVKQGYYRFRLLNASNSRTYTLAMTPQVPILQIGSDGGMLSAPVPVTSITMAPAERVDVVVDFRNVPAGTEIELTNSAPSHFPGSPGVGVIPHVMKFRVLGEPGYLGPIPASLRPVTPLHESDAVGPPRDFNLSLVQDAQHCGSMWVVESIQGGVNAGMHWDDIVDFPKLGTTEVWRFFNGSPLMHAMHIHLVQAQLLDRRPAQLVDGRIQYTGDPVPPQPEEAGWKDTFQVPPGKPGEGMVTRVIMRFEDYSGLYPLHCHLLEHEDNEMMRQFRLVECGNGIVEPGEQCDDGNTADGDCCSSTCQFEPTGSACNDGNACTLSDTCNATGQCLSGPPRDCVDANVCTADSCDPAVGCVHAPLSGGACDDGRLCTTGDTCQNGVCAGVSHANDPQPNSSDDWRKLACGGPGKGDAITPADIDCVHDVPNFSTVATLRDVCVILQATPGKIQDGRNDGICRQAEKELMAFALNRCRARVCDESVIGVNGSECGDSANATVGENWTEAAGLILDPSDRTVAMCNLSRCLSQEINNGQAFKGGVIGGADSGTIMRHNRKNP